MSEFWDRINADYIARGGQLRPEIWSDYRGPAEKPKGNGKGQPRGLPQHWNHGRPPTLTPRQQSEAAAKYAEGAPSTELAKEYGVGPNAILRAVRSVGGEVRTRRTAITLAKSKLLTSEQEIELVRGYADELRSVRELGVQFGIGKSSVYRILREHNTPIRNISEAQKIVRGRQPKWSAEEGRELRRRYEAGESLHALAVEFKAGRTGITAAIVAAGGTIRDRTTAIRLANANRTGRTET